MKRETQTIEFKQSWHDEYLEWICGYANAYGGTLYIGRNDDGTPCGVARAKSLMESIPCKITDTMGIIADVNLLEENGKDEYRKARTDEHVADDNRNDHLDVGTLVHYDSNVKSGILILESVDLIDTNACNIVRTGFTALEYT